MRRGAVFVAKALHDPSGEFAIVLYDPTVDDKPATPAEAAKRVTLTIPSSASAVVQTEDSISRPRLCCMATRARGTTLLMTAKTGHWEGSRTCFSGKRRKKMLSAQYFST